MNPPKFFFLSTITITLIALVIIAIILTPCFKKENIQENNKSSVIRNDVILMDWDISHSGDKFVISGESVQFLTSNTGMEEAAIADGVCTKEQVDNITCFNNPFYIHKDGYKLSFPLRNTALIEIYDYKNENFSDDNMLIMSPLKFLEYSPTVLNKPTLFKVEINQGEATSLREIYVP